MEVKPDGVHLSQDEADELASVSMMTARLGIGHYGPPLRNPTEEEREEAYALRDHIVDTLPEDESEFVLTPDRFPVVRRVAETALQNVDTVMRGLCTPSGPGGFRIESRGSALRSLALVADLSEQVRRLLPPIERV